MWTLEKKGLKPDMNVSWDDAKPTLTHMALAKLVEVGKVKFIITQNIDGLHLRSGVPRKNLAELHGNMFVDLCDRCKKMFVRPNPAPTVGQKYVGADCPAKRINGRNCRGSLKDFVLDWEHDLPEPDLTLSDAHSVMADLSIVMGSTLQIIPAGNMPTYTKKYHVSFFIGRLKRPSMANLCIISFVIAYMLIYCVLLILPSTYPNVLF